MTIIRILKNTKNCYSELIQFIFINQLTMQHLTSLNELKSVAVSKAAKS